MEIGQHKTPVPPQPGDRMLDGTVFAGSLNGKDLYATPADAPLTYTFNEAAEYAQKLNREKYLGHDDWRVPTKAELSLLFKHRAAIAGFNAIDYPSATRYWSGSSYDDKEAWALPCGSGGFDWYYRFPTSCPSRVRCVR
jgi:hypothetical protein